MTDIEGIAAASANGSDSGLGPTILSLTSDTQRLIRGGPWRRIEHLIARLEEEHRLNHVGRIEAEANVIVSSCRPFDGA